MKYIKKVTIENFQSHKYTEIEFDQRLNVIVGPSDSGKSAIIRALKWALYNEPSGDYFIREGEKDCKVAIGFNDGTLLTRYRSKSKNQYIMIRNNGEEIKFEGFGSTIPMEIVDEIGLRKIHLDSDETNSINLGEQLEGPFLLSEKTSTRASAIGRLVGVNVIDDALREVLRDSRSINIKRKSLEEETQHLTQEISSYDYLEEAKDKVNKTIQIKNKVKALMNKIQALKIHQSNMGTIRGEIRNIDIIIGKLNNLDRLDDIIKVIDSSYLKYRFLKSHHNMLNRISVDLKNDENILIRLDNLESADYYLENLQSAYIKYKKYEALYDRYRRITNEKGEQRIISDKLKNLDEIKEKLHLLESKKINLTKYKDMSVKYIQIKNSIKMGNAYVDRFNGIIKADELMPVINEKTYMLSKLNSYKNKLLIYNKDSKEEKINLDSISKTMQIKLEEYQSKLKDIEICPFCLSDIDEDKIEHIINHYLEA